MGKLKIWTQEEDNILKESFTLFKSKKWKRTSEKLKTHGYNRTDVECRQRYVNHLDPTVNKELWTHQQLTTLYDNYDQHKNKWFLIQKALPGRTQTKIKNYFYGNIRYLLKIIIKIFLRQSTGFINDVKTNILLDMYQGKNEFEGLNLIKETIKSMEYRVQKRQSIKLVKQNQQEFQRLARAFLKKYNSRLLLPQSQSLDNGASQQVSVKKQDQIDSQSQVFQNKEIIVKVEPEQENEFRNIQDIKNQPNFVKINQDFSNLYYNPSFEQIRWQTQFQPFPSQSLNPVSTSIQMFPNSLYNYPVYYSYQ